MHRGQSLQRVPLDVSTSRNATNINAATIGTNDRPTMVVSPPHEIGL